MKTFGHNKISLTMLTSWALLLFVVVFNVAFADDFVPEGEEVFESPATTFTLDSNNTGGNVALQFGATLAEALQWDSANLRFSLSDSLDLGGNELIGARMENLATASAPTCNASIRGQQYFDVDDATLKVCNGSAWVFADGTLLDEDDFASNSGSVGATQQSIGVYVDNFLSRALAAEGDGKYVINKLGASISYTRIENETPGGASLFAAAPDKITVLGVASKTFNSVELTWEAPVNLGDPISDYIIQFRLAGDTVWTTVADGVNTDITYEITGLTDDTTYEFRVTASNGNLGTPSDILTETTFINNPFFNGNIQMMNTGAATNSVVTAFEDNTIVTLNGAALTTLVTRGDTFQFGSAAYQVLESDKPVFVAGNASNSNVVWSLPIWAGENFAFNATRSNPQTVRVYAFEAATVEIKADTTTVAGPVTIPAGGNQTFTFSQFGSFQLESTGLVMPYHYSNAYTDPKPLLPASVDIVGFPSSSMQVTTATDSTNYNGVHSNSAVTSNSLSRIDSVTINPQGTSSLYQGESLRLTADQTITGASYADSNGGAAAPFVPTSLMRTRYAVNVDTDWVAFASLEAGTIQLLDATDAVITTLTLSRTGANGTAPYKAYYDEGDFGGKIPAGTRIVATVPVAAWYQPGTNTGAGNDDETVMFGYN